MSEDEENIMKILIATDIHLGYNENNPIRGNDSFVTFEEILRHAKNFEVDFVLLGGDLFHDTRPSTHSLFKCLTSLRRYCLGDREVQIEFLSDQSLNFKHLLCPQVNYENPNLNISVPIFTIHGNHDDPTGILRLSSMDILANTGLINYFGKWTDLTQVEINPILLQKGETKLALYGLSHIRDERLSRLFVSEQVKMPRPKGNYFNLLVLHQNRADRGPKNFIPEDVLPSFLDFVVWGHEHDCHITPTESRNGVHISQPGSSVATSLSEGESLTKHIGLLHVRGQEYKLEKILLKTVRPFVFRSHLYTVDSDSLDPKEDMKKKVSEIIEEMISEAQTQIHDDEPLQPKLPLIRLVFTFHEERLQFNAIRLGQEYANRVANPDDMILLKCHSLRSNRTGDKVDFENEEIDDIVAEGQFSEELEKLLQTYMEAQNVKPLNILSMKGMIEATTRFMDNNDETAFEDVINYQTDKAIKKFDDKEFDEDQVEEWIKELGLQRIRDEETLEIAHMLDDPNRKKTTFNVEDAQIEETEESPEEDSTISSFSTTTNSARRPARGRGSRGPRKPRGRAKAT